MKERYRRWRYLGLTKETLETFSDRVSRSNLIILEVESFVMALLLLIAGTLFLILKLDFVKHGVTVLASILSFTVSWAASSFRANINKALTRRVNTLIFFYQTVIFAATIYLGVYESNKYAALFLAATILLPVSFDMFPKRNLGTILLFDLIFTVLAYIYKDHTIFLYDMSNIVACTVLGLIISWVKAKAKWEQEEALELVERNNSVLYKNSNTDPLTGLMNRRNAFNKLEVLAAEAGVNYQRITCMIMDIDYFKRYDDNYGHPEGDRILEDVGKMLADVSTKYGIVIARIGGDEFMGFWQGKDENFAKAVSNEVLNRIHEVTPPGGGTERITFSIGVYDNIPEGDDNSSRVYAKADRAVYEAKKKGRDRVEFYDMSTEQEEK